MEQFRIYLGCTGDNKMRLGESLCFVKGFLNATSNDEKPDINRFIKAMSSVAKLYNFENDAQLIKLVNKCTNKVVLYDTSVDGVIKRPLPMPGEDYRVSIEVLKLLNEKIWPEIVKCVLNSFQKKTHTFRIKMPLKKINIEDNFKKSTIFTEDTRKWLAFHLLGGINEMVIEKDVIILKINLFL